MFCTGANFLSQAKNLIVFSASSTTFVPAQKQNLLNENHLLVWGKMFGTGTICILIFGLALALKIWTSTKYFGTCRKTKHMCNGTTLGLNLLGKIW